MVAEEVKKLDARLFGDTEVDVPEEEDAKRRHKGGNDAGRGAPEDDLDTTAMDEELEEGLDEAEEAPEPTAPTRLTQRWVKILLAAGIDAPAKYMARST